MKPNVNESLNKTKKENLTEKNTLKSTKKELREKCMH